MPTYRSIRITIVSDGAKVQEYDHVENNDKRTITCRIAGKPGEKFLYEFKNSLTESTVAIETTIDGHEVGAVYAFPGKHGYDRGLCTAKNFVKPFVFSDVAHSEGLQANDSTETAVGTLKFEVYRLKDYHFTSVSSNDNEAGIGLNVGEGEDVEPNWQRFVQDATYLDEPDKPYVTIKIFYGPGQNLDGPVATSSKNTLRKRFSEQQRPGARKSSRLQERASAGQHNSKRHISQSSSGSEVDHDTRPQVQKNVRRPTRPKPQRRNPVLRGDSEPESGSMIRKSEPADDHARSLGTRRSPHTGSGLDDDNFFADLNGDDLEERIKVAEATVTLLKYRKKKQVVMIKAEGSGRRKTEASDVIDLTEE